MAEHLHPQEIPIPDLYEPIGDDETRDAILADILFPDAETEAFTLFWDYDEEERRAAKKKYETFKGIFTGVARRILK